MPATALKPKSQPDSERQQILDKLGDLSHVKIAQNEFLMAIYVRSNRSPSGLYLTDKTVKISDHCLFQRVDPKTGATYGIPVKLYDWIVVKPSDGLAMDVNADPKVLKRDDFVTCRLMYDDMVRMVIDNPNTVW
jgi:hypothetical protein